MAGIGLERGAAQHGTDMRLLVAIVMATATVAAVVVMMLAGVGMSGGAPCPEGRACSRAAGISVEVPSGWHERRPEDSRNVLVLVSGDDPDHVGMMIRLARTELDEPLPTSYAELESRIVGDADGSVARLELAWGRAVCVHQTDVVSWGSVLTGHTWDLAECWYIANDRPVLVRVVDAPTMWWTIAKSVEPFPVDR